MHAHTHTHTRTHARCPPPHPLPLLLPRSSNSALVQVDNLGTPYCNSLPTGERPRRLSSLASSRTLCKTGVLSSSELSPATTETLPGPQSLLGSAEESGTAWLLPSTTTRESAHRHVIFFPAGGSHGGGVHGSHGGGHGSVRVCSAPLASRSHSQQQQADEAGRSDGGGGEGGDRHALTSLSSVAFSDIILTVGSSGPSHK